MRAYCEWGPNGAAQLSKFAGAVIIVDVMSFSTCVDVATAAGANVYPFPFRDRAKAALTAERLGAVLAGRRSDASSRYSLSPPTLAAIPEGTRLLLPSPNGSAIAAMAGAVPTLAGCLRNANAVAKRALALAAGRPVAVIPAGERWPDDSLRPAIEDLIGAGAILEALDLDCSPEAEVARNAYRAALANLQGTLRNSMSGRELIGLGFPQDVDCALELNLSTNAPLLQDGAFSAS